MKIYISNFNIDIINNIKQQFKEYLVDNKKYINIYTDENIYLIENNITFKLDVIDKEIKIYNNYFDIFNLIIDESYLKKITTNSILGSTHYYFSVEESIYKINKNSNLKLVILSKSHSEQTKLINDIYFETEKDIDINELFFKKELIEFLSMFN